MWALGFWVSAGSAFAALVLFLFGSSRYKHFKPNGNPLSKFCHVIVAAAKKWRVKLSPNAEDLYVVDGIQSSTNGNRRILHTHGFKSMIINIYNSIKLVLLGKRSIKLLNF